MKARVLLTATILGASLAAHAQDDTDLSTNVQRFSYGIGLQIGQNLKQQGLEDVDAAALAAAVEDVIEGRDLRLTIDEMKLAAQAYEQDRQSARAAEAETNKAAGEKFLAENEGEEGVVELDSGLQYRVVSKGDGEVPTETDTVVVHYEGQLLDGTVFDSSYSRGQPTELQVGKVIPGWQQALQLMPVGSEWEVWVPSELAYGTRGAGPIGPNQTLRFNIQLIEIKEIEG